MGRGVCGWGWRELGGQKLGQKRIALLLGEGKPRGNWVWLGPQGRGWGWAVQGGWERRGAGSELQEVEIRARVRQPARVPRGSHPPLSSAAVMKSSSS